MGIIICNYIPKILKSSIIWQPIKFIIIDSLNSIYTHKWYLVWSNLNNREDFASSFCMSNVVGMLSIAMVDLPENKTTRPWGGPVHRRYLWQGTGPVLVHDGEDQKRRGPKKKLKKQEDQVFSNHCCNIWSSFGCMFLFPDSRINLSS